MKFLKDVFPHARIEHDTDTVPTTKLCGKDFTDSLASVHPGEKEVFEIVDEGFYHEHVCCLLKDNPAIL